MSADLLQGLLDQLDPSESELLVGELLKAEGWKLEHAQRGEGFDFVGSKTTVQGETESVGIEVLSRRGRLVATHDLIPRLDRLSKTLRSPAAKRLAAFYLIATGNPTRSLRQSDLPTDVGGLPLNVWFLPQLLRMSNRHPEVLQRAASWLPRPHTRQESVGRPPSTPEPNLSETRENSADDLADRLRAMPSGTRAALEYQSLVREIFNFLFSPPLEPAIYEDSDAARRNRRDIIHENAVESGFWAHLRETYSAHMVVVDAKNSGNAVKKQPVLAISHYLKKWGCGLFGILATRKGASGAASHAIAMHWISDQKMIVVLADADLLEMLSLKATGGRPEEVIRRHITQFRLSL